MHVFRTYRKHILWAIIILVGVPMVVIFGLPNYMGGGGSGGNRDDVVASVGGVPVMASAYRRALSDAVDRQRRGDEGPDYKALHDSGQATEILEQMLDGARFQLAETQRGFDVDKEYLADYMKANYAIFQTEDGDFDPKAWNAWVSQQDELGGDWNGIYADVRNQVARSVMIDVVGASAARVLDSEMEQEFEDRFSTFNIAFLQVETKVEPTEEAIKAQYDENLDDYRRPSTHVADAVLIDMSVAPTAQTLELVERARAGEDFAALADEYSDWPTKNGGDMGWQSPRPNEANYRKPLFELGVGEVSDPVYGANAYYIYKVEEERTNEESGQREVKTRQIYIKAALEESERTRRTAQADAILEALEEGKDMAEAATEQGLKVLRTGPFTAESTTIEGIRPLAATSVARRFQRFDEEAPYAKVNAANSLYVVNVVETTIGEVKPFEEVADEVREDTIQAIKRTEEHREKVAALADELVASGKALATMAEAFPELDAEVKETGDFVMDETRMPPNGLMIYPGMAIEALRDKEPGEVAGPLRDWMGNSVLVSLVSKTPPSDEAKEKWAELRKERRDTMIASAENQLLQDYLIDLRTRIEAQPSYNAKAYAQIFGLDAEEDADAEETTEETGEDAADEPVEETTEEAPAEEAAE